MIIIGCLDCKSPLGCHHDVDGDRGAVPGPEDMVVCGLCGCMNMLDENSRPRRPTAAEKEETYSRAPWLKGLSR